MLIYRLKHQKFDLFSDIEDAEHLINACIIECFPEEKVRCKDLLKYGFYYTQFLKNSGLDQMSICILKNEIYSSSPLEKQLAAYFVSLNPRLPIRFRKFMRTIRTSLQSLLH
jgi:hypothetical protein